MKSRFLFNLFLITIFFYSCGQNSTDKLDTNDLVYNQNLISFLNINNNEVSLSTTEPSFFKLTYRNIAEGFIAYSADDELQTDFNFVLKSNYQSQYQIEMIVFSETSFQDTVFTFDSVETNYDFLEVHFVDVEQGDGHLIKTPQSEFIAVDGGFGTHEPSWGEPGGDDDGPWDGDGEPLMLNYVLNQGVETFKYLITTHSHSDHWGGIDDIEDSEAFIIENVLDNNNYQGFLEGDYLMGDESSDFFVQIMNIGYPPGVSDNQNDKSIVLKIVYGEAEYLLTGDAEIEVESYMISLGLNLSSDVLKVAHHGSNTSSCEDFLDRVFSQYNKIATISFGTGNPYGHPHSLGRFSEIDVFCTNYPSNVTSSENLHVNQGTIKTFSDGNIIIIATND